MCSNSDLKLTQISAITHELNNFHSKSDKSKLSGSVPPPPLSSTITEQQQQQIYSQSKLLLRTSSTQYQSTSMSSAMPTAGIIPPLDHYRLQLYNYAMVERLRCSHQYPPPGHHLPNNGPAASQQQQQQLPSSSPSSSSNNNSPINYPTSAAAALNASPYGPRFALSLSLFHNRVFQPEEPKPQHSYIGLIAMAILSSPDSKLVLSDIYQHILDNYPYFRTRGPGWRNSIRHNLSLNDCFVKAGRSANGKGHYWAIHPANLDDFKKGDFRRRKAQRKVRKHMGLAVDDEGTDSPSPPPLAVTPPDLSAVAAAAVAAQGLMVTSPFCAQSWAAAAAAAVGVMTPTSSVTHTMYSSQSSRKRQFDVASLLAPDDDQITSQNNHLGFIRNFHHHHHHQQHQLHHHHTIHQHHLSHHSYGNHHHSRGETTIISTDGFIHHRGSSFGSTHPFSKRLAFTNTSDIDEDIDVVASDADEELPPSSSSSSTNRGRSSLFDIRRKGKPNAGNGGATEEDDDADDNDDSDQRVLDDRNPAEPNYDGSKFDRNRNYHQYDHQELMNSSGHQNPEIDEPTIPSESPISQTDDLSPSENQKTQPSQSDDLQSTDGDILAQNHHHQQQQVVALQQQQQQQHHQQQQQQHERSTAAAAVANWHGIIQQWPNNFQTLGVAAAASGLDPRILGRYYGQYMAAAAAQQAVAAHHQVAAVTRNRSVMHLENSIVNFNHNNNNNSNDSSAICDTEPPTNNNSSPQHNFNHNHHHHHHHQQQQQQQQQLQLNPLANDCI